MEIDWSKAPEGATHAKQTLGALYWIKGHGGTWWRHNEIYWCLYIPDDSDLRHYIPRPTTQSWSGEGRPPVGVVCEYNAMPEGRPKKWHKVEVVYASDWVIVLRCIEAPNGHEGGNGVEIAMAVDSCSMEDIRPIRTPEQVAADEREAVIEEMRVAAGSRNNFPFAELYDAGFRKEQK